MIGTCCSSLPFELWIHLRRQPDFADERSRPVDPTGTEIKESRPHRAGVLRHGVFETDMNRLNEPGVARIRIAIVLPKMLNTRWRPDIGSGHRKPARPAAMQLIHLRSAWAVLTRFSVKS